MTDNWTFVCPTSQLLPGEQTVVWEGDTPILVINWDGEFYALEDLCSHEEFELSAGKFNPETGTIECVLHGAQFDLRDGNPTCPPAYEPVRKFPVRTDETGVWVQVVQ
ncbi:non-heme iron oxygenase ferredoxin subunit [Luteimonas sp. FXH3W]|jgi:3-phenylpropionate/trans-cinnamate dioxygenase ferredoxin subunit|uniref:Non-heme iron oxygenase ferredoxin subunit n=1 Tax=Aquilutibacter rugosus TaxID=3115820 RepID=A0ABU7V1E2_9GAMM